MRDWTRRDVIRTGLATAAGSLVIPRLVSAERALSLAPPASSRERLLFDAGWRFHLGHADDPGQDFGFGAGDMYSKEGRVFEPSRPNFDVSGWRELSLPHDWAVELPFENAKELISFGCKPLGRAYPATSIGWYRKTFDLPASDAGRRIALEFDGVFRDAMVALNGALLGRNTSGYAPVRYDVSDYVTFGGPNVLVVRVDATGREGWFYEGAGIYRHVWLTKTSPVHVAHDGSFVMSDVAGDRATLTIVTDVENEQDEPVTADVRVAVDSAVGERARGRAGARPCVDHAARPARPAGALVAGHAASLHRAHDGGRAGDGDRSGDDTLRRLHAALGRQRRVSAQRSPRGDQGDVQPPGPCGRGLGAAGSITVLSYRKTQGDGVERVSHVAQPADAGAARRLRHARHVGARRDAVVLVGRRRD